MWVELLIHSFIVSVIHYFRSNFCQIVTTSFFSPSSSCFFLKLEVQLHPSLHDSKNSLLSLWLCHGFLNRKPCLWFEIDFTLLSPPVVEKVPEQPHSDVRVLVYFGRAERETAISG